MTITLDQITDQLREPFPPKLIKFLPKTPKQREGKWFCMALPYADKRVYEDRLNALAPGQWETPPITALVADNKLIVFSTVIVCGIAHTDVGEAFLTSLSRKGEQREEENTATDAYAQAFKRACSQFGLGRYLYLLPKIWLPYDPDSRMIAISEGERVASVEKMYRKAGLLPAASSSPSAEQTCSSRPSALEREDQHLEATEQQLASLRNLRERLNAHQPEHESLSYQAAKNLIVQLSQEYKQRKQQAPIQQDTAATHEKNEEQTAYISPRDLAWVRQQLKHDEARIKGVCAYYRVPSLDQLTSQQALDLVNRLFKQSNPSSHTEGRAS